MPNYKTHDIVGTVSVLPISIAAVYSGYTIQDTAALAIGIILGTYFLSPDLDLHSRIYRRWGILRWIWIPYQKLIPHRSWLSHSGPISATLRIAYLSAWLLPVVHILNYDLHFTQFYGILWLAVIIADSVHVLADMVWKD